MDKFLKLKQNWEFRRGYNRGKAFVSSAFVVYVFKTKNNNIRLGITVGKKIGGAVQRNRAKRLITAAFRNCSGSIKNGYDFVIVARARILNIKSTEIEKKLMVFLETSGALDKNYEESSD